MESALDNSSWYFISCKVCCKKVKSRDDFFWCDNCNKKACFLIPRYRIQLKVEDSSGMAIFILFDSEVKKLLNISAKDFLYKCLEVYISDTSNECSSDLSSEQCGDSTKFQKVDIQSNAQLTPTSILRENKRTHSVTTMKQQRKKMQKTLKVVFQFI